MYSPTKGVSSLLCALVGVMVRLNGSPTVALISAMAGLRPRIAAIFISCAAAGTFSHPALAQDSGTRMVTLAEAISLAETNSPTIKIIGLQGQIASEGIIQAKGERRSRVSLALEYVQTLQNIISQDNTTFQEGKSSYPVATVTLTVSQPLYDAVRFRQLPIAQAEEALAQAQAESDRIDLSRQVVAAYLSVGQAQNRLREARQVLQVRGQFARDLEEMVASGRADSDQMFRAQSDAFAAETAVADAEAGLSEALFDLQRYTGVEVGGVQGGGNFSIADPRSLGATFTIEALEEMNPALQIAKAELVLAEKQLAQVKGRFRPTANLELQSEYTQSKGSLFGGGSTVASVDLGLSLEWSIYEGGVC